MIFLMKLVLEKKVPFSYYVLTLLEILMEIKSIVFLNEVNALLCPFTTCVATRNFETCIKQEIVLTMKLPFVSFFLNACLYVESTLESLLNVKRVKFAMFNSFKNVNI